MYVIGDVHGQYDKMTAALCAAGLIDQAHQWRGGAAVLWFMGDYFDRGPDGIAAIDLIMALQTEATAAGGRVGALIGNHDVLILAAQRFAERPSGGPGGTFLSAWRQNGGEEQDLARLTPARADWLRALPALALDGGRLLAHADATFYQVYGRTVAAVNRRIRDILHSHDDRAWDQLLDYFSQRRAFQDRDLGPARVGRVLALYGGRQLVHGHTPIAKLAGCAPRDVDGPLVYAGGLAIDVDAGMYLGGRGFAACLPEEEK
ncbi:Metallophosphoesterase [Candidatus Promineifilum breve]|uniref:Metallophosphoesterase n=1 Tax=Candidatus Promineifilum breve TaxID=1806508 RepID=A0A160T2F4_9CHLR|nr:metallophosphoesterase [Candidatus Promineifilum breve]CUS02630.2 Metallophosphoesterase [Candidatus Promineifilum breve]